MVRNAHSYHESDPGTDHVGRIAWGHRILVGRTFECGTCHVERENCLNGWIIVSSSFFARKWPLAPERRRPFKKDLF